jgi:hypothetical protein
MSESESVVADAAVHFTSRDRSKVADDVIADQPRSTTDRRPPTDTTPAPVVPPPTAADQPPRWSPTSSLGEGREPERPTQASAGSRRHGVLDPTPVAEDGAKHVFRLEEVGVMLWTQPITKGVDVSSIAHRSSFSEAMKTAGRGLRARDEFGNSEL